MANRILKYRNLKEPFVPIYQKLYEDYKNDIIKQKLQPGDRIHSINEMMQRHHIARETAKIVLKKLSDEGFIIQKPGKGSFVANLGPMKKIWAVIVPFFSAQMEELIFYLHHEADKLGRKLEHYVDYNHWEEEINILNGKDLFQTNRQNLFPGTILTQHYHCRIHQNVGHYHNQVYQIHRQLVQFCHGLLKHCRLAVSSFQIHHELLSLLYLDYHQKLKHFLNLQHLSTTH